ncbi:MAG: class A beta-lactamase-related serine hydrolase [Actinobacteria bacterium]|nr:class A beta-lactamase-related serine hydrolase [Actinomycetota bacterium]
MSFLRRKCLPVVALAAIGAALAMAPTASAASAPPSPAAACEAPRLQTADGCVSRAAARRKIEAIVRDEMARQGLKAAIVRVDTGTRPLLSRAYGQSMAGVPANTRMHFRIGSMAIPYLITVLLQLQEEGRLSLDDKLSEYRPQLPDANQITLRMLAENTSGYLDWIQGNKSFATALFGNVFKQWSVRELLAIAFARGMGCAPGTCFKYAHTNYAVLAQVISVVTGHSVRSEIEQRVLKPLGLRGIAISRLPTMPGPVLHSYNSLRGNYEDSTFWSPSWTVGAGTVMSGTIADVARSARAIGSGALLSPAASRERFAADPSGLGTVAPGIHFGLGILVGNGWRVQNPNLNGYTGIEAYLPSRQISVAIVTTLLPRSGASETAYSTELFNRLARYLTPGHPGLAVKASGGSPTASRRPAESGNARSGNFSGLVKIGDGRKLFLRCHGIGSPTVVLISGFRGGFDDWTHVVAGPGKAPRPSSRAVFPRVSQFTRVCAYDRPGTESFNGALSPSTPVRQPTTAADGVADLHALLGAAGGKAPYVLVAHSWGGMIAQLYARTYPQQVAGLVLLDPGSPYLKQTLKPAQWRRFASGARKLGDPRTLEAAAYEPSVEEIEAAPPAPKLPAVVLSSDHPFPFGAGGNGTWPAWLGAQDLLAAGLGARHVTHTDSGHYIAGERPGLVVAAVRQVVAGDVEAAPVGNDW